MGRDKLARNDAQRIARYTEELPTKPRREDPGSTNPTRDNVPRKQTQNSDAPPKAREF